MNFHVFCVNKPLFEIWQGGQPYVFLRDFGQKTCLGRKCDFKKSSSLSAVFLNYSETHVHDETEIP